MNSTQLVTIGIPIYNAEKFMKDSILSALNQSFSNIDFLFIDDGSTDNSVKIIQELQEKHPRGKDIRIIKQPYNKGTWAARNVILTESIGKYIYMMDSDDFISPNCIEKLFSEAEEFQAEVTYGSYQKEENGIRKNGFTYKYREFEKEDEFASYANLKFQITITNFVWNILIRTDFIRKYNLKFPETRLWEDVLFNADFQPLIKRAILLPDITYTYVIRNNSLSNYENRKKINIDEIKCHFNNNKYLKEQCLKLKGKPYYEMRCAKVMLQTYYSIVAILRNWNKITPELSYRQLRDEMIHPISLKEILLFKRHKCINVAFYLLGILPPTLSVFIMKRLAKYKKLL